MYCQLGQVERTAECLVELERRCRNMRQEVRVLSERQEILKITMEDKLELQSRATETYHDKIFQEMKELEEKKSEEALLLVQKRHDLWSYQNERDEARRLQTDFWKFGKGTEGVGLAASHFL